MFEGAASTIDHMNMEIEAYWGITGPWSASYNGEKVTIISSNIIISATESAICDLSGGINLEGCSITYPSNATIKDYGVYSGDNLAKNVTITAGSGIATGVELQDKGQRSKVKVRSGTRLMDKS